MSTPAASLLRAHLDQLRLRGRTTVALSPEAQETLARLSGRKPTIRSVPPPRASSTAPQEPTAASLDAPLGALRQELARVVPPAQRAPTPTPAPELLRPAPPISPTEEWQFLEVPGASVDEKLNNLAMMAEQDPAPRALGTLRETMVFAVGSPEARLMFIGEAPGEHEEHQREPFVGPAGQLLTKIIENAMGLQRSAVYISNICKFRPSTGPGQGSRNRAPTPEEMAACVKYIQTEILLIRPNVIVALGATAATGLGIQGAVGRLRAKFHSVDGIPTMVTYHPSYILRQEMEGGGMIARRQVWEDMLMVMEKLGMPISEKQRGYFRPKN